MSAAPDLLLQQLADPGCYPGSPADVTVLQTHISIVCLAGDRAYKLKKLVRLPFLDFSTLALRRRWCREEVDQLRYIIGTEVPIPGGATAHEEGVSVTKVEDAKQTIEVTRDAFLREGLAEAWERVVGVVVQPGVEFGDDFVLPYDPAAAQELSKFIESQAMVYEAHSTDYQTREALKDMVRDHFAILKVGPGLTFAFREAVFALGMIEAELVAKEQCSNIAQVLDDVMVQHPEHWQKY